MLRYQFTRHGLAHVRIFGSGEEALAQIDEDTNLVLLDIVMPGQGGLETLKQIKTAHPHLPVVMVSAQTNVDVALEAVRLGAFDYVTKGQDDTVKIRRIAEHIAERLGLYREIEALRQQLPAKQGLDNIIGESAGMAHTFDLMRKALRGDLTVIIVGESGTGKELIAQAIHQNSSRSNGAFVVVNCAAIPKDLLESEFFGHEKGSFTGAFEQKIGKFEQADGGTLFLDEIGEMSLELQAKLLRALQNRAITRVGGLKTINFDTRILCATHRDIRSMVQEGAFREDLYFRLFQFPITLPPLRERGHDILLLADYFRETFLDSHPSIEPRPFSAAARRFMLSYRWAGNVRELKSAVERALMISDTEEINVEDLMLDSYITRPLSDKVSTTRNSSFAPLEFLQHVTTDDGIIPLDKLKELAVLHAYEVCGGNIEKTAARLGVARSTIYRTMRKAEGDA